MGENNENPMTENYLDILQRTIRENWDQPALTDFYLTEDGMAQDTSRGNRYTYGEMYGEMMRLGELFRLLGLQKGDHIAICGSNSANWAVAYLSIAAFQGVAVTVLHSQNIEDIASQIDFSDSVALFTDDDLWDELQSHNLPQVKHVISLSDWSILHGELIRENCERTTREEEHRKQLTNSKLSVGIAPDDLAMICFTSGSSGVTKGVMLSIGNISATIYCVINNYTLLKNRNMAIFLPMAHLLSTIGEILSTILQGAKLYICGQTQALEAYLKILKIVSPFEIVLPPIVLEKILYSSYIQYFFEINKTLDYCIVGGAIVKNELAEKSIINNIPFTVGYGLTETSALISIIGSKQYKIGTCGKICETLTARISPASEILVRGENVMLGYYKNPEATAEKIDKDGWLHTGDAGYMDEDGYLYVTGRIGQDMIVLPNGENIHPEDIENKINALPEVQESIVIARDGHLVAIVRLTDFSPNTPNALKDIRHAILRAINHSYRITRSFIA